MPSPDASLVFRGNESEYGNLRVQIWQWRNHEFMSFGILALPRTTEFRQSLLPPTT